MRILKTLISMIWGLWDAPLSPKTNMISLWRRQDTSNNSRKSQNLWKNITSVNLNFVNAEVLQYCKGGCRKSRRSVQQILQSSWRWDQYLPGNTRWKFGNMVPISSNETLNVFLKLWNFDTKKLWNPETLKPRNQEAKTQEINKQINFSSCGHPSKSGEHRTTNLQLTSKFRREEGRANHEEINWKTETFDKRRSEKYSDTDSAPIESRRAPWLVQVPLKNPSEFMGNHERACGFSCIFVNVKWLPYRQRARKHVAQRYGYTANTDFFPENSKKWICIIWCVFYFTNTKVGG